MGSFANNTPRCAAVARHCDLRAVSEASFGAGLVSPRMIGVMIGLSMGLLAETSAARAATYCVTCSGPEAQYACAVDAPASSGVQLYCIAELAKSGKHARCQISRGDQSNCSGETRTLAAPPGFLVQSPQSASKSDAPVAGPPAAEPTQAGKSADTLDQKSEPPKTVQAIVEKSGSAAADGIAKTGEAAIDATKQTGNALQKAGNAITVAVKKTWTCVASLFGNCEK